MMQNYLLIFGVLGIIIIGAVVVSMSSKINQNHDSDVESYTSCGCGCCEFGQPLEEIAKTECLYKSKGDNIQDIIDRDKRLTPDACAAVGCSFPVKYVYCD